jgi:hypothetical protein
MPSDQHKPHDPAILIWVPVGETPTTHAFAVSGASTFRFLPDAVIHALKDAAHRPEKPWLSTSNVLCEKGRVIFTPPSPEECDRAGHLASRVTLDWPHPSSGDTRRREP